MIFHIPMHTECMVFLTSFVFPMFGQGGGTVFVPTFLIAGFPFLQAVSISQLLIASSVIGFILLGRRWQYVHLKLIFTVEPPTLLGAFVGGYFSGKLPLSEWMLKIMFYVLVMMMAVWMLFRYSRDSSNEEGKRIVDERKMYRFSSKMRGIGYFRWFAGIFLMFFSGICASILGIGGGLLKVPAMTLLLDVPITVAAGTSSLMVGLTAIFSFLGHFKAGHFVFVWDVTNWILCAVLGGFIAANFIRFLPKSRLSAFRNVLLPVLLLSISTIGLISVFCSPIY